jgi:hypothetical protein
MEHRTFEGTWEELARRGAEWTGRRVRLTVIDDPPSSATLDHTLVHPREAAGDLVGTLPSETRPPLARQEWSEGVVEKYRHQGFDL